MRQIMMITYDSGGSESMAIVRDALEVELEGEAVIDMCITTPLALRKVKEGYYVEDPKRLVRRIRQTRPDVVVVRVTDNVNQDMLSRVCEVTGEMGIPIISLVDVLTPGYKEPKEGSFKGKPTKLLVPNKWGEEFLKDEPYQVIATGNPAFDSIPRVEKSRPKDGVYKVFFPSQPIKTADGEDKNVKAFEEILGALEAARQEGKIEGYTIDTKRHPYEEGKEWDKRMVEREVTFPPGECYGSFLSEYDIIVGLTSTVLIKGSAIGIPSIYIEPGEKDTKELLYKCIDEGLSEVPPWFSNFELNATEKVVREIKEIVGLE